MHTNPSTFRQFIELSDELGDVVRETSPVSPVFEIAAHLVARDPGPITVFSNVEGWSIPVVGNVLGSLERIALAIGAPVAEIQSRMIAAIAAHDPVVEPQAPEHVGRPVRLVERHPGHDADHLWLQVGDAQHVRRVALVVGRLHQHRAADPRPAHGRHDLGEVHRAVDGREPRVEPAVLGTLEVPDVLVRVDDHGTSPSSRSSAQSASGIGVS